MARVPAHGRDGGMIGGAPFHRLRFEGRRFDCGDKLGYLEAIVAVASAREDLQPGFADMPRRHCR